MRVLYFFCVFLFTVSGWAAEVHGNKTIRGYYPTEIVSQLMTDIDGATLLDVNIPYAKERLNKIVKRGIWAFPGKIKTSADDEFNEYSLVIKFSDCYTISSSIPNINDCSFLGQIEVSGPSFFDFINEIIVDPKTYIMALAIVYAVKEGVRGLAVRDAPSSPPTSMPGEKVKKNKFIPKVLRGGMVALVSAGLTVAFGFLWHDGLISGVDDLLKDDLGYSPGAAEASNVVGLEEMSFDEIVADMTNQIETINQAVSGAL